MTFSEQVNGIVQAVTGLWSRAQPAELKEATVPVSTIGSRYDSNAGQAIRALEIFGMSTDYLSGVMDCKRLSEANPIFSGILDKVVGPVADVESYVKVDKINGQEKHRMIIPIEKELNRLITEVRWNERKDELLRNLLNEGGTSLEIVSDNQGTIRALEYRPHYTIVPLLVNGRVANPEAAYQQIDIMTRDILATFAKWQIVDLNWKESAFGDRGIPYLMASRRLLSSVGDMIDGVVRKWLRSGGEIEFFSLKGAKSWQDVEEFQSKNSADLRPSSKNLVRQFFAKGDIDVERLHGDKTDDDTAVVEFLLELIFLATGVSKEIMGFKGHLVLKDMASISLESYYRLLNRLQSKGHAALRRACDIQLLTRYSKFGVLPEQVDYQIVGGRFSTDTTASKVDVTVKGVDLLNQLMTSVDNKQPVLDQIVGVLTYDLKDYGISFKEELEVAPEPIPIVPTTKRKKGL